MQQYCKSFEAETMLRFGNESKQVRKLIDTNIKPRNTSTLEEEAFYVTQESSLRPAPSRLNCIDGRLDEFSIAYTPANPPYLFDDSNLRPNPTQLRYASDRPQGELFNYSHIVDPDARVFFETKEEHAIPQPSHLNDYVNNKYLNHERFELLESLYQGRRIRSVPTESSIKYDGRGDRLTEHIPVTERQPQAFLGGGAVAVPEFNLAGDSTRFDNVVRCS